MALQIKDSRIFVLDDDIVDLQTFHGLADRKAMVSYLVLFFSCPELKLLLS